MKKILLALMFGMVLISFTFAQQTSLGFFKQGECINLIQICGNCTYNNVTSIFYPNSTLKIIGEEMAKNGIEYNYTFCNTSKLGSYFVHGIGDLDGVDTTWAYDFKINPTGKEVTSSQGFASIGIIMAIIFLATLFSFFGFKLSESEKLFPISLFFLLLSLLMGVITIQLAYTYSRDILFSLSTEGLIFKILLGSMWGLMAMAFIALLMLMLKTLKELKVRKSVIKNSDGFDGN